MAKDRTLMSHTYDEQDALRVVELIFKDYTPVLHKLSETLASQRQLTGV
jgi:predicted mannosyl-3-phosphoglycerate phosphatase (HAD superfamily)